jgi:hypothetical protein
MMIMILNESFSFSIAPLDDRRAFLREPERVLLRASTRLYKWTSYPLVGAKGITPWWSFVIQTRLPSGFVAEGFRGSETQARRLGVPHREYQRVRGAVSEKFNNKMQDLLLIQLNIDAYGFAGPTSGQQQFKDPALANVYLIGGKGQVYIPNLTGAHVHPIPAGG